uniref:serine--tRNA ligase n=1 Tax=Trepomonas sp. PC1 TaxID=1076344 RepID=A0A146KHR0_9EUKA|eukprot:JAP95364.1 Seryl-tRNA synthetase [Trepomonas sp. PC1]
MVLDINMLRKNKGGNPDKVKESQRRRFASVELVDEVIALDEKWVQLNYQVAQLNKQNNQLSKQYGIAKKNGEPLEQITEQIKELKEKIANLVEAEKEAIKERDAKLFTIGNLVPDEVPVSNDEAQNAVRQSYEGQKLITTQKLNNHIALFAKIAGTDTERGTKVAGGRGYFLCGPGALLNQAVINYAQHFLTKRGFIIMQTPFFLEKDVMARCAQLADFDEQLYKVTGEGQDKYLIATSEQSLCSYFMDEQVDFKAFNQKYANFRKMMGAQFPTPVKDESDYLKNYEPLTQDEIENGVILFAGYSSCFRKEVGNHGQDTLGIFRIHQFEKVEQLVICKPELSARLHHFMINLACEFYQELGLPYHVVDIVSGALNDAAARKFDLEAWFPASQCYRELVSCSNCLDYQSRNLDIKYQNKDKREFVHLLNSTLSATERTMCCIVENWAREDGIEVPPVLRPYMMGIEKIPYTQ